MADNLIALDQAAEKILPYIPAGITPPALCSVKMVPSWNLALPEDLDEPVDVILQGGTEWALKMTQHTLYTLASNFSIPKALLAETPPNLTQPLVNYWLDVVGDTNSPRFVYNSTKVALDLYRPYAAPPLDAIDLMVSAGDQMATDSDSGELPAVSEYMTLGFHELTFRLFFPPLVEGVQTSTWQAGVQITTSPSGQKPTSVVMVFRRLDGLLFAVPRHEFKYSQKRHGASSEAFEAWLHDALGLIMADVQEERDRLVHLAEVPVIEDLQTILDDFYATVSLPMSLRAIVNDLVEDLPSDANGYDLLECVAMAALDVSEPEARRERARRAAGRLYAVLGSRCTSCHSLLKDHADA